MKAIAKKEGSSTFLNHCDKQLVKFVVAICREIAFRMNWQLVELSEVILKIVGQKTNTPTTKSSEGFDPRV